MLTLQSQVAELLSSDLDGRAISHVPYEQLSFADSSDEDESDSGLEDLMFGSTDP